MPFFPSILWGIFLRIPLNKPEIYCESSQAIRLLVLSFLLADNSVSEMCIKVSSLEVGSSASQKCQFILC